jgi:hypothetical protein
MGSRWTARRRSQTRIEENHIARHDEKVGYLAPHSSGRSRRAQYGTRDHAMGKCSFLKIVRTEQEGYLDKHSSGVSKAHHRAVTLQ